MSIIHTLRNMFTYLFTKQILSNTTSLGTKVHGMTFSYLIFKMKVENELKIALKIENIEKY